MRKAISSKTGDLEALTLFNDLDEVGGLHKGFMRARVQPGNAPAQFFHVERVFFEVNAIEIRDLKFSSLRRLQRRCILGHMFVIEIQAGNSPVGNRGGRLFEKIFGLSSRSKTTTPYLSGSFHPVGKDGRSLFQVLQLAKAFSQTVAVEDVISENEA